MRECLDLFTSRMVGGPSTGRQQLEDGETHMLVEKIMSNHITKEFIKQNRITTLKIKNEGEMLSFENRKGEEVKKLALGVEYEGMRRDDPNVWTLNNKSFNALIDIFGKETRDWIDRIVEIKLEGSGEYEHIMVDTMRTRK